MTKTTVIFSLNSPLYNAQRHFIIDAHNASDIQKDDIAKTVVDTGASHLTCTVDVDLASLSPQQFRYAVIDAYLSVAYHVTTAPKHVHVYGAEIDEICFLSCFDRGLRDFHRERFDLSLLFNARDTYIKQFEFSEWPKECHYISFQTHNNQGFILTTEALRADPIRAIKSAADFLLQGKPAVDDKAVIIIHDTPEHQYDMRFCTQGNDISFFRNNEEVAYWVCDEFSLDDLNDIQNTLGAVAGSILTHD